MLNPFIKAIRVVQGFWGTLMVASFAQDTKNEEVGRRGRGGVRVARLLSAFAGEPNGQINIKTNHLYSGR